MDRLTGIDTIVPVKRFEFLHEENYDIVINNTASDEDKVNALRGQIETSLTSTKDPLAGWIVDDQKSWLRFDILTEPKYVAKTKWKDRKDFIATVNWGDKYNFGNPNVARIIHQNRVFNSLLNEMDLSAQIRDLIVSDEAQEVAKKYGYLRISYVEPLVGLIDKKAGKKTVIYEYVENTGTRPLPDLVKEIKRFFLRKGIYPGDIDTGQFLISNTPEGTILYLVDTEAYEKATKHQVDALLADDD